MAGRLIAPGGYQSAELRIRGTVAGRIAHAGIGPKPKPQVGAACIGLAAGQWRPLAAMQRTDAASAIDNATERSQGE